MQPRVALVSGFWGQNIGNAFFNVGGKFFLERVFGKGQVDFILDQPGYRTFNDQTKGNPKNDFGLLRQLDVDFVVLQGPMLTVTFPKLWDETFSALTARGTKIILLSAAFFKYTEAEKEVTREFLRKYPATVISTRDSYSYEALRGVTKFTYSGIDSGFFVNDAYNPFNLVCAPCVALTFDRFPEPNIMLDDHPQGYDVSFEYFGHRWYLSSPTIQSVFSKRGKWQAYIGAMLDRRYLPVEVCGMCVVRPEHRFNPHVTWKIYRHPSALVSDEPYTYLTVYGNSALTLSDRVHACVATLAYGNPAMLFTPSPRARLFERVGLGQIKQRPVVLDPVVLVEEKKAQLRFFAEAMSAIQ